MFIAKVCEKVGNFTAEGVVPRFCSATDEPLTPIVAHERDKHHPSPGLSRAVREGRTSKTAWGSVLTPVAALEVPLRACGEELGELAM